MSEPAPKRTSDKPLKAFSKASGGDKPSRKKTKRKGGWKRYVFGGLSLIIAVFLWWGFQPITITGSILFGICRTYVELQVPYPEHLRFTDIVERNGVVNVSYIYTDGFGERLSTDASCVFKPDAQGGAYLDSFRIRKGAANRSWNFAAEDPAKVKAFNETLPFVAQAGPSLVIFGFPKEIRDYK